MNSNPLTGINRVMAAAEYIRLIDQFISQILRKWSSFPRLLIFVVAAGVLIAAFVCARFGTVAVWDSDDNVTVHMLPDGSIGELYISSEEESSPYGLLSVANFDLYSPFRMGRRIQLFGLFVGTERPTESVSMPADKILQYAERRVLCPASYSYSVAESGMVTVTQVSDLIVLVNAIVWTVCIYAVSTLSIKLLRRGLSAMYSQWSLACRACGYEFGDHAITRCPECGALRDYPHHRS